MNHSMDIPGMLTMDHSCWNTNNVAITSTLKKKTPFLDAVFLPVNTLFLSATMELTPSKSYLYLGGQMFPSHLKTFSFH